MPMLGSNLTRRRANELDRRLKETKENVEDVTAGKGKGKAVKGKEAVIDAADVTGEDQLVKGFYNPQDPVGFYHAPLAAKVALHKDPLGEYSRADHIKCLGNMIRDIDETLKEAYYIVGEQFGLISIFLKYRDLAEKVTRVGVFLNWSLFTDVNDPAWRLLLYQAWLGILSWYYDQLGGGRRNLAAMIDKKLLEWASFEGELKGKGEDEEEDESEGLVQSVKGMDLGGRA
ncbi:hypothetical protein F5Y13DRAFT_160430 [Hypoxylon sp. FL1857]|nr:hypothetical protein F5Y13DRAFT_160430 [Hypoxylon sp. FL1857]